MVDQLYSNILGLSVYDKELGYEEVVIKLCCAVWFIVYSLLVLLNFCVDDCRAFVFMSTNTDEVLDELVILYIFILK